MDRRPDRGEHLRQPHPRAGEDVARRQLAGVTPTTRRLLAYWTDAEREKKLFFCQIEALETAIYIAEVAEQIRRRIASRFPPGRQQPLEPRLAAHRPKDGDRLGQNRGYGDANCLAGAQQNRKRRKMRGSAIHSSSSHPESQSGTGSASSSRTTPATTTEERDIVPPDLAPQLFPSQNPHHQFPQVRPGQKAERLQGSPKFLNPTQPDMFKETPGGHGASGL